MHLPNIADFDITHLSYSQMMHLSIEQPDEKLFIVPNSVNASTATNIEKYDFENMSIFKSLWVGFNCMKRNRLYLVPRIYTNSDQPPSYSSKDRPPSYSAVVSSEEVRGSERGRSAILRQRRSSRALSIIQQLDACHLPIRNYRSSPLQRLAGAPVTSFRSIDEDLEDLVGLCFNRASVIQIFFTGATGTIPPPVPHLADDLRRLSASLNTLRQALQTAAKGDCRTSRFEILEDAEKVVIGIKKWVDKMKPLFEHFRIVMIGDNDEFHLKVTPGNHVQWARKAREMEQSSQAMADKVFALRTIVEEAFEPWTTGPATSTPSGEATAKDEIEASEPNWDLVQIARLAEVKWRREEEKRQLAEERRMAAWRRFAAAQEEQGAARQSRREVSTMATAGRVRSRSI